MRGPLTVVLASCLSFLLLGVGVLGRGPRPEEERGGGDDEGADGAAPAHRGQKSLARGGFTIVPDKKLAAIEADLGLIKVSDSYSAVAREVKATAFVAGIMVGGRRPKARVVVRNADGKIIGAQGWQATSLPKLLAAVNATATPKLSAIINGGGGGGRRRAGRRWPRPRPTTRTCWRRAREAVGQAEAEAEAPAEEAAAEEEPAQAQGRRPRRGGRGRRARPTPRWPRRPTTPEPRSKAAAAPGTGLNLAFVLRMFSRNFAYNESVKGGQQGYQAPEKRFNNLPLVPAPGLALEYFPASIAGVFANFNYGIAGSKDTGRQRLQDQRLLLDDRRQGPHRPRLDGHRALGRLRQPRVQGRRLRHRRQRHPGGAASTTGTSAPAAASACPSASAASWPAATTCTSSALATSSATSTSRATPSAARCSPAPSSRSASSRTWTSAPGLDFRRIAFAFTPAARRPPSGSPAAPSTSTSA